MVPTYGKQSGTIWMSNVRCKGSEPELRHCDFDGWAHNNCTHDQDVGVKCLPANPKHGRLILYIKKHPPINTELITRSFQ